MFFTIWLNELAILAYLDFLRNLIARRKSPKDNHLRSRECHYRYRMPCHAHFTSSASRADFLRYRRSLIAFAAIDKRFLNKWIEQICQFHRSFHQEFSGFEDRFRWGVTLSSLSFVIRIYGCATGSSSAQRLFVPCERLRPVHVHVCVHV